MFDNNGEKQSMESFVAPVLVEADVIREWTRMVRCGHVKPSARIVQRSRCLLQLDLQFEQESGPSNMNEAVR